MSDLVGHILGSYKIIDEIGHGGMANVYRAVQPSIGREVAVKVLPTNFLQDRMFLERFSREVQVIAKLQHPHILPVYDFGEQDGLPYIVMAYMTGGTLSEHIKANGKNMPLDEVARLISQIAQGLDFAHKKGIIHRDFKPSNVLIDEAGNTYLADFGIAKATEGTVQLTGSGIVGTPTYMAPEMADQGGVSPLVDVYALGVTLYQILTGELPYSADTPMGTLLAHITKPIPDARILRPDLPDTVQHIIERALAKNPKERYQTAGALASDLQSAISGLPHKQGTLKVSAPEAVKSTDVPASNAPAISYPVREDATEMLSAAPRRGIPTLVWVGGAIAGLGLLCGLVLIVVLALNGGFPGDLIGTIGLSSATRTPAPTDTPAATITPTQPPVVENNSDWTPIVQEFDGVEMVLVPPGCFMMGSTDEDIEATTERCNQDLDECDRDWFRNESPQHEICFEQPFWLDRTEVTNGQYYGSTEERPENAQPHGDINWLDATDFCEAREARLPTEAEWEYATRGPDSLLYPWGNEFVSENVSYYESWSNSSLKAVGSFPDGVSWVGALDLLGNLSEWTSTYYHSYPYDANDGREEDGTSLIVRGGSHRDYSYSIHAANRESWLPDFTNTDVGFRCARDY
ncbi:MAG: SUMF1/EgtB/PvdO family nonheme iron enzyme [Anaerolineae bacterium]|nr:SUMF1/EgtB/PvdO family nonheme iron enzyme [Anaerolineae bacterium]